MKREFIGNKHTFKSKISTTYIYPIYKALHKIIFLSLNFEIRIYRITENDSKFTLQNLEHFATPRNFACANQQ